MRPICCYLKDAQDARYWQSPIHVVKCHAFAVKRFWHLAAALVLSANTAYAAKFGPLQVDSTLGTPLNVAVPLYGVRDFDFSNPCINASVTSLDGRITIRTRQQFFQGRDQLLVRVRTDQSVNEPALAIAVVVTCDTALTRTFQFLLDPPEILPLIAKLAPDTPATVQEVPSEASPAAVYKKPVNVEHARVIGAPLLSSGGNSGARRQSASVQGKAKSRMTASVSMPGSSVLRLSLDTDLDELALRAAAPNAAVLQGGGQHPVAADPGPQSAFAQSAGADALLNLEKTLAAVEAESRALHTAMQRLQQDMHTERIRSAEKQASIEMWVKVLCAALAVSVVALGWALVRHRSHGNAAKERKRFDPASILVGAGQRLFAVMRSRYGTKHALLASSEKSDAVKPSFDKKNNESISESTESMSATLQDPSWSLTATVSILDNSPDPSFDDEIGMSLRKTCEPALIDDPSALIELAEAWLKMEQYQSVIKILEPYKNEEPPESPVPWFFLLNAYAAIGDEKSFASLYLRLRQHFNVCIPDGESQERDEKSHTVLADFPHVRGRILALWGSDDLVPYLEGLLSNSPGSVRAGFPLSIYRDIIYLIRIAKESTRHAGGGRLPPSAANLLRPLEE